MRNALIALSLSLVGVAAGLVLSGVVPIPTRGLSDMEREQAERECVAFVGRVHSPDSARAVSAWRNHGKAVVEVAYSTSGQSWERVRVCTYDREAGRVALVGAHEVGHWRR